ncbi:Dabb family protein [Microbacterium sp. NPDC089189]|uniref:Dabb family protein n=1 Tax=Microbacterium sp. NPDC089189 TaxID=3154972 RepID=UPI00342A5318
MLRHIVLFRVHDGVSSSRVTEAIDSLRSLAVLPGIVDWRVELSLDQRKGRIVVEDATFTDDEAFEKFRSHPAHVAVGQLMAEISDWWNGDYSD